jgi:hypothetical protein
MSRAELMQKQSKRERYSAISMSKVELMQKQRELFHKEPGPELNWF